MPEDILTDANDVDVVFEQDGNQYGTPNSMMRKTVNEFTITVGQTISSEGMVGQHAPAGLSKGDLEYTFSFTLSGDDGDIQGMVSDEIGDSLPFNMTAKKVEDGTEQWSYSLRTCLADTEEVTGTTGETLEVSVEGMAARLNKDV